MYVIFCDFIFYLFHGRTWNNVHFIIYNNIFVIELDQGQTMYTFAVVVKDTQLIFIVIHWLSLKIFVMKLFECIVIFVGIFWVVFHHHSQEWANCCPMSVPALKLVFSTVSDPYLH